MESAKDVQSILGMMEINVQMHMDLNNVMELMKF